MNTVAYLLATILYTFQYNNFFNNFGICQVFRYKKHRQYGVNTNHWRQCHAI